MATNVQTTNLPPVPSTSAILVKVPAAFISQPWNQWFIQLRTKVNVINDLLVTLAGAGTPAEAFNALSPLTTQGDMLTYESGNNVRLPIGTTGQVLTVIGGLPSWQTSTSSSPLTTKGDLYTYTTTNARLPVGTNGQVLTANSSAATGLAWATNTPTLPLTTTGDLLTYLTGTGLERLAVGTDGQVLTARSTSTYGVDWETPSGGGTQTFFGLGAPSTLETNGDLYFDLSISPAGGYVQAPYGPPPYTDGTPVTTTFSTVTSGTITVTLTSLCKALVIVIPYEKSGTPLSVSSVTATGLTFTQLTTVNSDNNTGYCNTDIWYAPITGAETGLVVTVTFSAAIDDGGIIAFGVRGVTNSGSPFVGGGSTGLPAGVPAPATTGEAVTATLDVPSGNTMLAISTSANTPAPAVAVGFTEIASLANTGGTRYCYCNVGTLELTSAYTTTVSSSGLSTKNAVLLVTALAAVTGNQWVPFN